jgi:PAS domain S-box-containing protein
LDETAIVIADTSGIIHFWSKGAEDSFGHSAANAVGQPLDLIVPVEFRNAHWRGFHRAISAGAAAAEGRPNEFPVLRADGNILTTPGRLVLLRLGDERVIGAMVIFG